MSYRLFLFALCLNFLYSKTLKSPQIDELQDLSDKDLAIITKNNTKLDQTYVLVFCMNDDRSCQMVEDQVKIAVNQLYDSAFAPTILTNFQFRKVQCQMVGLIKFCKEQGMDNRLQKPIAKIIGNFQDFKGWIYPFTSPFMSDYFKKKILMFSIPKFVLPLGDDGDKLRTFEEVREKQNVVFCMECLDQKIMNSYEEIAQINKERYYFFSLNPQNSTCLISATGFLFQKKRAIDPQQDIRKQIQEFIKEGIIQDLKMWDIDHNVKNKTFVQEQKSLIILGLVGRDTESLSTDFQYEFRKLARFFEFDTRYSVYLLDSDHVPSFLWMTSLSIGRFDVPGIIAIQNLSQGTIYRNYETYNGFNFQNISYDMIGRIKRGDKQFLYTNGFQRIYNAMNFEYWLNNKLQFYTLFLGLLSAILIPIFLLIDCFFPILGRGPGQRKKSSQKLVVESKEDLKQDKKNEKKSETKKNR